MENDERDYYIHELIFGCSVKNSEGGMVIHQSRFWSAISELVESGTRFRIETLPIGSGEDGLSFLYTWDLQNLYEVRLKPHPGVAYQPFLL